METKVWKSDDPIPEYYLVNRDEKTGELRIRNINGSEMENSQAVIDRYAQNEGGFWGACRYMGDDNVAIFAAIRDDMAQDEARREQEAQAARQALACTKDGLSVAPFDVMQNYELLEAQLEQLKPGDYHVCINYKKRGIIELRKNRASQYYKKNLATICKEDKTSKAALHRFAVAVRKAYEENIIIINRTSAIKAFGKKMVDSVPFIMTRTNPHYAKAAPSKVYDKLTLDFLRLEELEARYLQNTKNK